MKTRRTNQQPQEKKGKKTGGSKRWTANYRNKHGKKLEIGTEQEQQSDTEQTRITEEEGTDETNKQRKEQANQALWKKVDMKTIITGARYRKMEKQRETNPMGR